MFCKAQNIEDYEKSIIYFLGFALTMVFAERTKEAKIERVSSEVNAVQAYYCSYCSTRDRKVPLYPQSKSYPKYGPEPCSECGGDGLVSDVRNGKVVPNARKCDVCKGTGGKFHIVTERWLHCNNCGRNFSY